jgi:DNA polymerase-3 subunit gamma/tau
MVGQEHVVQALGNALTQQRLHHAYLFTGTRGIGKTTVSRILAKSLNCTGPDGTGGITAEPCGVCQACTEIDADRYIDYIELDAASNRGIDEIRDLIEQAAYKPVQGRFKVFMIDEAHHADQGRLQRHAEDAGRAAGLPEVRAGHHRPDKMLPTVLSRCLQFNLRPMAPRRCASTCSGAGRPRACRPTKARCACWRARRAGPCATPCRSPTRPLPSAAAGWPKPWCAPCWAAWTAAMRGPSCRPWRARRCGLAGGGGRAARAGPFGRGHAGRGGAAAAGHGRGTGRARCAGPRSAEPDTEDARALAATMAADETQLLYSMVLHGRGELNLMSDEYAAPDHGAAALLAANSPA